MRSPFPSSAVTKFSRHLLASLLLAAWAPAVAAPVHLVDQPPAEIKTVGSGVILVDFGRVAFGNLRLTPPAGAKGPVTVRLGEAFKNGRIDGKPPQYVRFAEVTAQLNGAKSVVVAPPADERNTQQGTKTKKGNTPPAVLTPPDWGVVMPFRWVEIEGWPGELKPDQIVRQAAFPTAWNDDAASFKSSDEMVNRIWELCRYSIKATGFAGVYVDGDRERIPYEADAYLTQLSDYASNGDPQMARDTFDRLMKYPTWPTEWAFHMIFMAHADWMQTGDKAWLDAHYESLKPKLLLNRVGPDGLIVSSKAQQKRGDIVDWPVQERDGFVFKPINTAVNAFYLRALAEMAEIARAVGKTADADDYEARLKKASAAFQTQLFDAKSGLYRDGVGTDHSSLHANLFPLAFGLVPEANREHVAQWVAKRGMKCSVYAAQYLFEGLFENHLGTEAMALMTAPGDRSWRNMVDHGTTITWEAWSQNQKANLDWNHAWGAAPANLVPRFVLGAQPLKPGWQQAEISPNPGELKFADGKVPTPRGPIIVSWKNGATFDLSLTLPAGMTAKVDLPALPGSQGVFSGAQPVPATRDGSRWLVTKEVAGNVALQVR